MSNFDKAVSLIYQAELEHIGHTNDLRSHPSVYVTALQAAGLLAPDFAHVTRLTVVSGDGRRLEEWGITSVTVVLQDDGQTLKIFYKEQAQ